MAETWKKLAFYDEVATTFLGLSDSPADYAGDGLKLLRVNATPDAVEFVAQSGLKLDDWGTPDDNTDLDATAALHGLMAKLDKSKLDGVATGADVTGDNAPQAHKDLHDPQDGSDPLDAAAPAELVGVQASGEGSGHEFARADHAHQIQHSIADNHLVTIDGADIANSEIARFTANGLESRTPAEVAATMALDDIGVPDAAVALNGQQATDMVVHSVANAAARPDPVIAKICHQQDDDHMYLCTVAV